MSNVSGMSRLAKNFENAAPVAHVIFEEGDEDDMAEKMGYNGGGNIYSPFNDKESAKSR